MLLLVVVLHQSLMALLDRKKANEILIPAEKFSRDGFSVQLGLTRLPTDLKNTRCILFFHASNEVACNRKSRYDFVSHMFKLLKNRTGRFFNSLFATNGCSPVINLYERDVLVIQNKALKMVTCQ